MHTAIREDSGSYHVGYRVFLLFEKSENQAQQNGQDTKSN